MHKSLIGLLLFSLVGIGCQQNPKEKLQVITSTYQESIEDYGVVACLQESNSIAVHAIGMAGSELNMTEEHRFGLGSCTKLFTATVALRLFEEGAFQLTDRLSDHLELPQRVHPETTIKDLLQHTSGIGEYASSDLLNKALIDTTTRWTDSVLLSSIPAPDEIPGMVYQYRNTNYLLVRKLLEEVSGKTYEQLIAEYIIFPLNLNNTFVGLDNGIDKLAHPIMNGTDFIRLSMAGSNAISRGSGNLVSDVKDLNTFIRALLVNRTLLKATTLEEMLAFRHFGSNHVGLGIFQEQVNHQTYIGHTGRQFSYLCYVYVNPENNSSMVLMCNNMNDPWTEEMVEHLFLAMR